MQETQSTNCPHPLLIQSHALEGSDSVHFTLVVKRQYPTGHLVSTVCFTEIIKLVIYVRS